MKDNAENLKSLIQTSKNEDLKSIANQLFNEGEKPFLVSLLNHKDSFIRNAVALTFKDQKYENALEPLIKAIQTDSNRDHRGTLVYALRGLNCGTKLVELFNILFTATNNWEVQDGILSILDEQKFDFASEDLQAISTQWNKIKSNWNSINGIEEGKPTDFQIDDEEVTETVNSFLAYL